MMKSAASFELPLGRRVWLEASQRVLRAAEGAVNEALLELEQHALGRSRGAQVTGRMRDVVALDRAAKEASQVAQPGEQAGPSLEDELPKAAVSEPPAPGPCEGAPGLGVAQEPIRTRTYARLLSAQGQTQRALAIYVHLMAESPRDASLAVEATELRRRLELDADLAGPA